MCVSVHELQKVWICVYIHSVTLYLCECAPVCLYWKCLCWNASECVFVCPSLLGKVIHHSKHQMTSPPTPILQLLPLHPPHILHSDGLAGCHQPPSSSSFPPVLHLTQLWCWGKSAESSPLATVYTRLTWVRCRLCWYVPVRVRVHANMCIWGSGFVINTVPPPSLYTLVRP